MAKPTSNTPALPLDKYIKLLKEDYEISQKPKMSNQEISERAKNIRSKFTFGKGVQF